MDEIVLALLKAVSEKKKADKFADPQRVTMREVMEFVRTSAMSMHESGTVHFGPTMNDAYITIK